MGKIKWWKVRRELRRAAWQLPDLVTEAFRKIYFRRWYDMVTARKMRRIAGDLPMGRQVALYLIFPSNGVLASHLSALRQMQQAGVSAVVISNLPLRPADIDRLRPLCAQIIERPNVGYDFGGYRDGILGLAPQLAGVDWLYLLNDSAWLLPTQGDWFAAARSLDCDFVGATTAYCYGHVDGWREITWDAGHGKREFHYGAFALAIGAQLLHDGAFLQFWRKLDISNNKKRTVQRGEIGLSQWVIARGYRHGATCATDHLDQMLASHDDDTLDQIAQNLIVFDDPRLIALKSQVLAQDPYSAAGRDQRIAMIVLFAARQGAVYALSHYLIGMHGLQFLKKSPARHFAQSAQIMQQIVQEYCGADPDIMAELAAIACAD